jgi:proteasome lid subunit RPN8/RPN11
MMAGSAIKLKSPSFSKALRLKLIVGPALHHEALPQPINRLLIDEEALKRLCSEAAGSRVEVCGLLLGRVVEGCAVVEALEPLENIAASPSSFKAKPEDVYRAYVKAEGLSLEIVGIYHSHPAPPKPSGADVEGMRLWPVVWLIVSSLDSSAAAFQLQGGCVKEVELTTRGAASSKQAG